MGRLFTFGCSFTQYHWPTWADILGKEFEYFENWGKCGSGNQFIFNSIIECNARNHFTKDDTVIIMWSGIDREDRYVRHKKGWLQGASVYLGGLFYTPEWIKEYACDRGYLLRDLATISATIDLLEHWGVKYELLAMSPVVDSKIDPWLKILQKLLPDATNNQDVINLYQNAIGAIKPSVFEVIYNKNWFNKGNYFSVQDTTDERATLISNYNKCRSVLWPTFDDFYAERYSNDLIPSFTKYNLIDQLKTLKEHESIPDFHPSPIEHLSYLNKVLPEYTISNDTIKWIDSYKLHDPFNQHLPTRL